MEACESRARGGEIHGDEVKEDEETETTSRG
jgi:hypothetical protein